MPKKINGRISTVTNFVDTIKCDKYIKEYAGKGIIDLKDWQDESKFSYDDARYIMFRLAYRVEHPERYTEEEIKGASRTVDKLKIIINDWTEKYDKLLREGEEFDPRPKGFNGPIF